MLKEMLSGHNAMSQCGKIAAATTFRLQQLLPPSIAADGFCISSPPLLQTIGEEQQQPGVLPGCRLLIQSHRHAILFLNILVSTYQPRGLTLDDTIMLIFFV